MTAESSDADDTAAGAGARKVLITGLDATFAEITEEIILNGVTPVAGAIDFIRVNKTEVIEVGATGSNEGVILIKHGSNVLNHLRVDENRSDGAIYTVPLGKSAIVYPPSFAVSQGTEADVFIKFRRFGGVFIKRKILSVFENSLSTELEPIIDLSEKADLLLHAKKLSGASPKASGIVQVLEYDS